MPVVKLYPVGEVLPTPLPNAQLNVPAAGDISLFGGNQAQDLQVAGQRLGQASDNVFAIYERMAKAANDTRVQDFNNQYIAGEREILRTGPDAYYKQNGADAINGAAATTERLTKLKERVLGQAANEHQRQRLRPILDAHHAASADGIVRYAGEQQAVYGRTVANMAIETSKADAVANPANLANAMARAEGATRALFKGQAPEVIENEVRKVGGSIVSAVIGDYLVRNDPRGVTLFRQYRERLDPSDRRALGAAAETLTSTVEAAAWLRDRSARLAAEKARAQPPQGAASAPAPTGDAALDAVNVASASAPVPPPVTSSGGMLLNQEGVVGYRQRMTELEERRRALSAQNEREFPGNPSRLRVNQAAIEADSARGRAMVKAEADKAYAGLQAHMTTGGPGGGPAVTMPPATIMSQFTDEQQASIARQVNRNVEGRQPKTDVRLWYDLFSALTSTDPKTLERASNLNLTQFAEHLSMPAYLRLKEEQENVRKGVGTSVRTLAEEVNLKLRGMGIDPSPRPDNAPNSDAAMAARFHHAFQDELTYFEEAKRGKVTPQEARSILARLAATAVEHGIHKRVFLIGYADVPAEDRYQIHQAIRDSGAIPTEQRVVDLFRRRLMTRPPQTEMAPPVRPGESEMRLQVEAGRDVERGRWRGASLPLDQRLPVPGIGPKPPESR